MTPPRSTREALLVEALDEAARLIRQVEALVPAMAQSRQGLADAQAALAGQLATFEPQLRTLTDQVKLQAVQHVLARTDEAARRSADMQARAMADAARVAFGAEVGANLQRLRSLTERGVASPRRAWEPWLTHAAAAAMGAALSWTVAITLWVQ